jgi:hypothetical protein
MNKRQFMPILMLVCLSAASGCALAQNEKKRKNE